MPDSWEIVYSLNLNSTTDVMQDADDDWYCNVLEYIIGDHPTDPAKQGVYLNETNGGTPYATYP